MDPNDPRLDEMARRMTGVSNATMQRQRAFEGFVSSPLLRSLASGLGIDIDGLLSQQQEVRETTAATLQAAIWFGPFGWTVSGPGHGVDRAYSIARRPWSTRLVLRGWATPEP